MSTFTNKVAYVTGAASGIGAEVAQELGAEGASVAVVDLNLEAAEAVAKKITSSGGKALALQADVGKPEDIARTVSDTVQEFGGLHLAFNNAGIGGPQGPIEDIDLDEYHKLMDINLHSVLYGLKYQIPEMLKSGGGSIVNTSSILGLVGTDLAVPYVMAKHGIAGLTKAAAIAYSSQGIRVNSVHPGYIETPLLENLPEGAKEQLVSLHPIGRLGTVEEVAKVVLFLLSDGASFVTGSQYTVDGAYTAQ